MPLDPSIILGGRPAPIANPFELMDQITRVQAVRDQAEDRRAALELRRQAAEQAREEARERAQVAQAYQQSVSIDPKTSQPTLDHAKLARLLPPTALPKYMDELRTYQGKDLDVRTRTLALGALTQKYLGDLGQSATAAKGDTAVWTGLIDQAHAHGAITDQQRDELKSLQDPQAILARAQAFIGAQPTKPELVERVDAQGRTVKEWVIPKVGEVYVQPTKAPTGVNIGSFEDYVVRYAAAKGKKVEELTPADIEDARKRYQQADDRPRITVNTGGAGGLPPRVETTVRGLATRFGNEPSVKRTVTMAEAASFVNSLNLDTKNPADDQALIYAFAKAMDPESVVREGEYATVQKYAQSWLESFGFDARRVLSSNVPILTRQSRQNLKNTVMTRYRASRQQYDNLVKSYSGQINKATGLQDGSERLTDYATAFPDVQETGSSGGGRGGSALERYRRQQGGR